MQTPTLLSFALVICGCVARSINRHDLYIRTNSEIDTEHTLYARALQKQNSVPVTKGEVSKAQKQTQPNNQQRQTLNTLQRQNSAPITKSNVERAKKQVKSSSQNPATDLSLDIVLGHQKDKAKALTAKSEASHQRAGNWQKQVNSHFAASFKAFKQGNEKASNRNTQQVRWKAGMTGISRQKAEDYANDARQATGVARVMEVSGVKLRN